MYFKHSAPGAEHSEYIGIMTSFFRWKQTWRRVGFSVEKRKGILWNREHKREQKKLRGENSKKKACGS